MNQRAYMKRIIINGFMAFALALMAPQIAQAQGTITYVSNLGQPSSGSFSVGSDSWFEAEFITGTNAGGYLLDSVQLAMTEASGNPSGFTVMLYGRSTNVFAIFPGSSLGTLNGSLNPVTGGIYTYTPTSSLALSPRTGYFIVLTAGTAVANGAYQWSVTSTPTPGYNEYHWAGGIRSAHSSDGLNWLYTSGTYGQFAINATGVPEPGVLSLFVLGGLGFLWHRRKAKAV
jgi:hypothetical protein